MHQRFTVNYEFPVLFTRDVFAPGNPALRDALTPAIAAHPCPRLLIYVDDAVASAHPALAADIDRYLQHHLPSLHLALAPQTLRGGEGIKSDRQGLDRILRQMAEAQLDRHSFVMVIGGGALLDAVGYAASLIHRGVRLVRLPTTVLSQNDGGVGVKTAINDSAGKNFLGTFAPPFAVINDFSFLRSLPDAEWRSGIAEAFKVAMIKDAEFFDWLCANATNLAARDDAAMENLVIRCAALHLKHIRESGDPFEMGQARPLDFGHWSAHQIEMMTDYAVSHGYAVAIGIMIDTIYAARAGWLDERDVSRLLQGLHDAGFVLWHDILDRCDARQRPLVLEGLQRFREHLGGRLAITMPRGVGDSVEISEIDEVQMTDALQALRKRVAAMTL